jgi:hypothetical protein
MGADSASPVMSAQDAALPPACRQSDQLDIRDPLTVPSGTVNTDAAPSTTDRGSAKDDSSPGLSQVLGRVLQQLSVSAWVPAAMLVGNVAVLLQLHSDKNYDLSKAVKELAGKPLGTLIILAFALILATVVTQAFEFELIRFFEGYFDSTNRVVQAIMAARIRRYAGKVDHLDRRTKEANQRGRLGAAAEMRQGGFDSKVLEYLIDPPPRRSKEWDSEPAQEARRLDWKSFARPADLYRIESALAARSYYPDRQRLLPTRLGNVLRAAEDTINLQNGENIEGYVIRFHDQLPVTLQNQHKEFRTRLDMYCSLTLVFPMLTAISLITLGGVHPAWGIAVATASYLLMAWLSYEAAIKSARSYGLIIREIDQYMARQKEEDNNKGEISALGRFLAGLHRTIM